MATLQDICHECGHLHPIVNKFHYLCDECNYKRLHGGKSRDEVALEKHKQKEKKKTPPVKAKKAPDQEKLGIFGTLKKKYHKIKPMTDKRAEAHRKMLEAYKRIDASREKCCEGCGRGDVPLSHSHLLSKYDRLDLVADENNIRLHCFGNYHACHETWERGVPSEVIEMLDFEENLEYIKATDKQAYNTILANFEFLGVKMKFLK